jgi:small subunit ribosomal protein S3Ae
METTLGDLTSDPSKQMIKLIFRICEVDGNVAHTEFIGHQLTRDYIRGLVKRMSSKIDVNVDAKTADGRLLRVKSSCFTLSNARASHIETIRGIMKKKIKDMANDLELSQYIQEIVLGKLSSDIYKDAKKIHALRRVEIRKIELLDR